MWRIDKGPEPPCLADRRREVKRIEDAAGSPIKDPWSRDALLRDQHHLCAYCGGRLDPSTMKIEHFVPQSADRSLILDWSNLLGACPGRYRDPTTGKTVTHCDSHRTKFAPGPPPRGLLSVHPAQTDPGHHFRVNITAKGSELGTVETLTGEAKLDLAELNLNAPRLVDNRAKIIRDLRASLSATPEPKLPRLLRRRYKTATTAGTDGLLPPYAPIEAEYLLRKLRQRRLDP